MLVISRSTRAAYLVEAQRAVGATGVWRMWLQLHPDLTIFLLIIT